MCCAYVRAYTTTTTEVIDYMISDSLQIVSDSLESCLRPVFSADGEEQALEKDDAFEKYLRLWRMIEIIVRHTQHTQHTRHTHTLLSRVLVALTSPLRVSRQAQNSVVSRSDLLRIIFQENVSELETYER
jgi:hypothetical protein